MEPSVVEEILDELLPSFEALETQSGAILQFLKDKGIATDEGLAPYLQQARSASAVRWRAARLRMNHVLAPLLNTAEKNAEEKGSESAEPAQGARAEIASGATQEQSSGKEYKKQEDSQAPEKEAEGAKKDAAASVEKDNRKNTPVERSNKDAA